LTGPALTVLSTKQAVYPTLKLGDSNTFLTFEGPEGHFNNVLSNQRLRNYRNVIIYYRRSQATTAIITTRRINPQKSSRSQLFMAQLSIVKELIFAGPMVLMEALVVVCIAG
jgi:hypothetical protein